MFFSEPPTYFEQALAAQQTLFDTVEHASCFPRMGAVYNTHATDKLVHVWQTMIDGIRESTHRITRARMTLPVAHISQLLSDDADPQAVDALSLICFLPVLRASVQHGAIAAFELITILVRAGHRLNDEALDAIASAFN